MIAALAVIVAVLVTFAVLGLIAAMWERLPMYPPTEDDILPPPNVRSQRYENTDFYV